MKFEDKNENREKWNEKKGDFGFVSSLTSFPRENTIDRSIDLYRFKTLNNCSREAHERRGFQLQFHNFIVLNTIKDLEKSSVICDIEGEICPRRILLQS